MIGGRRKRERLSMNDFGMLFSEMLLACPCVVLGDFNVTNFCRRQGGSSFWAPSCLAVGPSAAGCPQPFAQGTLVGGT
eukprot:6935224-Alexandrium_andersonii.AAC.1